MKFVKVIVLCLSIFCALGNQGCHTTDTIILPTGPKTAALMAAKNEQIKGLVEQVKAEQEARLLEQALASKAASGLKGILKANSYLADSPIKEAIGLESDLALKSLPADDPAETVKSLERVVALITGQRDEAQRLYKEANAKIEVELANVKAKDVEIAKRDTTIKNIEARVVVLMDEAEQEKTKHANDVKKALDAKDEEIKRINDENASKERATWILWTRIISLGLVVIGAVIAIVFKIIPEGMSLVGVGVLIGLISMFVDWLTHQWWFPWLMGTALLGALIAGSLALWRAYKRHTLQGKVTAALQDLKDESVTLGNDVWAKTEEHLKYRLGEKDSEAQKKLAASLGLTNLKADEAIKAADSVDKQGVGP